MADRILASLFVIGLVATGVGAGTLAWFRDFEMSTGNTFTAGTIDLAVNGQNPLRGPVVTLEGKPSEWKYVPVSLANVGSNDGIKYVQFWNVTDSGGVFSEPEREADPDNRVNDLSKQIEVDINGRCLDFNHDGKPDTLGELPRIRLGVLKAGEVQNDTFSFHVKTLAGNQYQGDITTFNIEFGLQQMNDTHDSGIEPVWVSCTGTSP